MKVFLTIIGIGVAIWIIYFLYLLYNYVSIFGEVKDSIEQSSYNGIVNKIDTNQKLPEISIIEGDQEKILFINEACNDSLLQYINMNDSIEKKQGEMIITIYRPGNRKKQFQYDPCIM
jgi:mannitol-specific phosphotransferase system IIBC component